MPTGCCKITPTKAPNEIPDMKVRRTSIDHPAVMNSDTFTRGEFEYIGGGLIFKEITVCFLRLTALLLAKLAPY